MTNFNFLIKECSNQKQKTPELSKTHNIPIRNGTTIHYSIHHNPIMTQSFEESILYPIFGSQNIPIKNIRSIDYFINAPTCTV